MYLKASRTFRRNKKCLTFVKCLTNNNILCKMKITTAKTLHAQRRNVNFLQKRNMLNVQVFCAIFGCFFEREIKNNVEHKAQT